MTARLQSPVPVMIAGLAGLAVLAGLLAGISPLLGVGLALGVAFVAVVFQSLAAGICVMAFISFLDAIPKFGGVFSVAKVAGFLLAASWAALTLSGGRRERQLARDHPLFTAGLVLFLVWAGASLVWAEDQGAGISSVLRYVPMLLLFPITYTGLRTERDLRWVVTSMVAAAILSGVLGVLKPPSQSVYSDFARASGLAGGVNELAAALVVGVILCLTFLFLEWKSILVRPVLVGGVLVCALGLFLSLSRGGLVALFVSTVGVIVFAGRWRGKAAFGGLLVVGLAVFYFAAVASLPARERVLEVGGGTGRTDLWTVGGRMVSAHPLTGVGTGQFPIVSIHYLLRPGAITQDQFIITKPKVAHNTVLEVLAELGAIGAALFVSLVLCSMWWTLKAAHIFEKAGLQDSELICRGLLISQIGFLTAGMFISENYTKLWWILFSLGPAAYAIAQRRRAISSA